MRNEGKDQIPIIAMTAHAMAGDEDKSLQAGMNGHVTKPIDPDQLFSTLQKWIKPSEKRVQVQQPEIPAKGPEAVQTIPEEEGLPESLPEFDLADGLKRLQVSGRKIAGQTFDIVNQAVCALKIFCFQRNADVVGCPTVVCRKV